MQAEFEQTDNNLEKGLLPERILRSPLGDPLGVLRGSQVCGLEELSPLGEKDKAPGFRKNPRAIVVAGFEPARAFTRQLARLERLPIPPDEKKLMRPPWHVKSPRVPPDSARP